MHKKEFQVLSLLVFASVIGHVSARVVLAGVVAARGVDVAARVVGSVVAAGAGRVVDVTCRVAGEGVDVVTTSIVVERGS